MTQNSRTLAQGLVALATLVALGAGPVAAQDDQPDAAPADQAAAPAEAEEPPKAPPSEPVDRLRFRLEASDWVAQPAGLEFEPVSVIDPTDPFGTTIDDMDFGTQSSGRYGVSVEFPNGQGGIQGTWWGTSSEAEETVALPGSFVFGELLAFPALAGFANDGLADGYTAQAETLLRELRLDYFRTAFESKGISGRWFVGYRQVAHDRRISASYFAFEPLLPPLFPPFLPEPRPDLDPLPDTVALSSEFEGRGVESGLQIRVPVLAGDRLWFEGAFALAALRGDVATEYRATNAAYIFTDALGNRFVLAPPYDIFDDVISTDPPIFVVDSITQETGSVGVRTDHRSQSASVIEAELGLRWRFWKTFELFGGFRSSRYDGVGVDLEVAPPTGSNLQAVTEESRSVYYEGFFFGLTFGF